MSSLSNYILLVEDDPDDQYLIRQAIRDSGSSIRLDCLADGLYLEQYLLQCQLGVSAELPRMILLDLNMPALDGKKVLQWLKGSREFCSIPVVVFTTSNSEADIEACYRLGANSYVIKPLGYQELSETVAVMCEHWLKVAALPCVGQGASPEL